MTGTTTIPIEAYGERTVVTIVKDHYSNGNARYTLMYANKTGIFDTISVNLQDEHPEAMENFRINDPEYFFAPKNQVTDELVRQGVLIAMTHRDGTKPWTLSYGSGQRTAIIARIADHIVN